MGAKCRVCGRPLISPASIDIGVGPKCREIELEEADVENQVVLFPASDVALSYIKATGQWDDYQNWKKEQGI